MFTTVSKKGNLSNTENFREIIQKPIAANIYNLLILNRIRPKIDRIIRKNQNGFRTNSSTNGQILIVRRIIDGVKANNLHAILLFIDFSKAFDSIDRNKMREILLAYGIPKEVVNSILILYTNTRAMVRSPDRDTPFFYNRLLQTDTIAPFLFIICLDYVLRKSIECNTELGLQITERNSTRYLEVNITYADYADDIAITINNLREANLLLHSIEKSDKEM